MASVAADTTPLISAPSSSGKQVTVFGMDIWLGFDYDFVFVFPVLTDKEKDEPMPNAEQAFQAIFKRPVRNYLDNWRALFRHDVAVTKKGFQRIVWETLTNHLTGEECGFQVDWKPSVDDDELFVCVKLPRTGGVAETLASELGIGVPVASIAYPLLGHEIPLVKYGLFDKGEAATCHIPYSDVRKQAFQQTKQARLDAGNKLLNELLEARKAVQDKLDLGDTLISYENVKLHAGFDNMKTLISRGLSNQDVPAMTLKLCLERMEAARQASKPTEESQLRDLLHLMAQKLEQWDKDKQIMMERMAKSQTPDVAFAYREAEYGKYPSSEELKNALLYQPFRHMDYLRVVHGKVEQAFDLQAMTNTGAINQSFFVHEWEQQEDMMKTWANPLRIFQAPNSHLKQVRNYFGERVGFFYHWMDSYIELLSFPAILGLLLAVRFWVLDRRLSTIAVSIYALIMCVWTTIANGRYNQLAGERCFMWGMTNASQNECKSQNYKPEDKGGLKETFFRLLHWLVLVLISWWTVYAAYKLSDMRFEAKHHLEGVVTVLGGLTLSSEAVYTYGKYMITINIKICSYAWDFMTEKIATRENWETNKAETDSTSFKCFIVKFIVYYYPFFYTAFCKPYIEGCGNDAEGNEKGPEGCADELRTNVGTFLLCHLACTFGALLVPYFGARYVIWQEKKKQVRSNAKYDMLQLQSKLPAWAGASGIDYIDTVINLGFTTMFSCISPTMTVVCLLTLMIEARLFAFRDVFLSQRATPSIADSIGPWLSVMQAMAYISVIVNVAFLSFMMWPLRTMEPHHQLVCFLAAEHGVMLITILLSKAYPLKTTGLVLAEEINYAFLDEVINDDGQNRHVEKQQVKALVRESAHMCPVPAGP